MPELSAADRRYAAIGAVVDKYAPEARGYAVLETDRQAMAADIDLLRDLGRTDRWRAAVKRWRDMVADEANTLHWALFQGSIFAGHAAS